jgi:hypothetical protein
VDDRCVAVPQLLQLSDGGFARINAVVRREDVIAEGDISLARLPWVPQRGPNDHVGDDNDDPVAEIGALWPDGEVPYFVDEGVSDALRGMIGLAISEWERDTRIDFIQIDARSGVCDGYPDCVKFFEGGRCAAETGRLYRGRQYVELSAECGTETVMHELGHVVGLFHEHNASDRDTFIEILWDNINDPDVNEANFETYIAQGRKGREYGPYDFASLMHYPPSAFAKAHTKTIALRPAYANAVFGNADALSQWDRAGIESMYGPYVFGYRGKVKDGSGRKHCDAQEDDPDVRWRDNYICSRERDVDWFPQPKSGRDCVAVGPRFLCFKPGRVSDLRVETSYPPGDRRCIALFEPEDPEWTQKFLCWNDIAR